MSCVSVLGVSCCGDGDVDSGAMRASTCHVEHNYLVLSKRGVLHLFLLVLAFLYRTIPLTW